MNKPNSEIENNVLERLRTGSRTQNFSAILNSPEEPVYIISINIIFISSVIFKGLKI